ncbi:MAG TPA: biosynthetic peptidoglycan transglycosylase, partial [Thermoanaerobaculia bacterium]|nr:biosynthetic peptidoglycan transglycosylase [Thermoanaerobaculia bacterium]
MSRRGRSLALVVVIFFAVGFAGAHAIRRYLEARISRELVEAASKRGLSARVSNVSFSFLLPVVLSGLHVEKPGAFALDAARVDVGTRLFARSRLERIRFARFHDATLTLPSSLSVELAPTRWNVVQVSPGSLVLQAEPGGGRVNLGSSGGVLDLVFDGFEPPLLGTVRRGETTLVTARRVDGRLRLGPRGELGWPVEAHLHSKGLQVPRLSAEPGESALGAPTDLDLSFEGIVDPKTTRAEIACLRAETEGVSAAGEGTVAAAPDDLLVDVNLDVTEFDLRRVLASAGLPLSANGRPLPEDLGSASMLIRMTGHMRDPSSVHVEQKLAFKPPREKIPPFEALKGPFTFIATGAGGSRTLHLVPGSPDYTPLDAVPPLFIRTLLISEDAGFWGHPGIDLAEVAAAAATNWARGEKARGGSTISQQLAKNLFLSREKSYSRKLQELAFTLLLESTLGKRRILEIYVNVIEWGPGVYGLKAAACRYFGKEPSELTP